MFQIFFVIIETITDPPTGSLLGMGTLVGVDPMIVRE